MIKKYSPMNKLKTKRLNAGMTQTELAKIIGVDNQTIYFYESGYRFPRKDILLKLAEALECTVSDIL